MGHLVAVGGRVMDKTNPLKKTVDGCELVIPEPCGLVIFGASGDLAKRKLLPALFHLFTSKMLPDNFFILGTGRDTMNTEKYREVISSAISTAFPEKTARSEWKAFSERIYYTTLDYRDQKAYVTNLRDVLLPLERKHGTGGAKVFYLAVPPTVFEDIVNNIGVAGLAHEESGTTRIVIEKPFGRDLESARGLEKVVHQHFQEHQVYRIDHYLAKETVQNILMFRFANSFFEPLWNRRYIDHVQITASETLGVEHRAGYYDQAGVIRDMFPNHMFQLLAIMAMEPPSVFMDDRVRDEKVKVFRSIRQFPLDQLDDVVAIGQYAKGTSRDGKVPAYREEEGVAPGSGTPTYAAMKIWVDNWRWQGVPFYLRSGKRLAKRITEIAIHFRQVPHSMFLSSISGPIEPSVLVLRIQPDEGMTLTIQTKLPGSKVCLNPIALNFTYGQGVHLDAYEWVLLDCMLGDHMLFTRRDGVEETWKLLSPVIERLESRSKSGAIPFYPSGSDGPEEAKQLLERDGRTWRSL
jgi:glucose-6-phosphate 1-dehydrogenase